MKKKLIIFIIMLALAFSTIAIFTACEDEDDEDFVLNWTTSSQHLIINASVGEDAIENGDSIPEDSTIRFNFEVSSAHALAHIDDGFMIHVYNGTNRIHTIFEAGNSLTSRHFDFAIEGDTELEFRLELTTVTLLTPTEARNMMFELEEEGEDFIILDTRQLHEFLEQRIQGAILIPYQLILPANRTVGVLPSEFNIRLPDRNATILVYCRAGRRSMVVSSVLAGHGFNNIYDMGGLLYDTTANSNNPDIPNQPQGDGWIGAGYPTVSGCTTNPEDCSAYGTGFPCLSTVYHGAECGCPPRSTTCPFCDNEIVDGFYCDCDGRMLRFNFSSFFLGEGNWSGLTIIGLYDENGEEIELRAKNGGRINGGNLIGHADIAGGNPVFRLKFNELQSLYVVSVTIGQGFPFTVSDGDGYQYVDIELNMLIIGNADIIDINIHLEYD
ncbi:MAG: rhodanese-like domain-containing protein [Firmicutes bacterium]|nr:rhodanese-like domain-containing protein [Bacillota bacterium]